MFMATKSNHKRVLYVGGLSDEVTEELLTAAFIPFGEVKEVLVPRDYRTGKKRGFGFVEFLDQDDASAAMDNMNESELFGKTLSVNVARPQAMNTKAVWDQPKEEEEEEKEGKEEKEGGGEPPAEQGKGGGTGEHEGTSKQSAQ